MKYNLKIHKCSLTKFTIGGICIILCFIQTNYCFSQQKSTVTFGYGNKLIFTYVDQLDNSNHYTLNKQSPKQDFLITKTTLLYNSYNGNMPMIIIPNDSIHLSYEKNRIQILGNNKIRANDQELVENLIQKYGRMDGYSDEHKFPYPGLQNKLKIVDNTKKESRFFGAVFTKSDSERDSLLFHLYNKRINYIQDFKKQKPISSEVEDFLNTYLKYLYLETTFFGIYKPNIEKKLPEHLVSFLNLEGEKLFSDSNLTNHAYRVFVKLYNSYLNYFETKNNFSIISKMNTALKHFSGYTKDYLLYDLFKVNYNKADLLVKKEMLLIFNANCKNSVYNEEINSILLVSNPQINTSVSLLAINNKTISLDELLENKKDSLVYIDFWASWCMPCRNEFDYYDELKKEFKNEKVAFVFISLDESISAFKNTAIIYKSFMTNSNSFLLVNNFNSSFAKKMNIKTIPRYIIYSKSGIIINDNAPRPSEQKLTSLLKSLLKKA